MEGKCFSKAPSTSQMHGIVGSWLRQRPEPECKSCLCYFLVVCFISLCFRFLLCKNRDDNCYLT